MHERNNPTTYDVDTLADWDFAYIWHPFTPQKEWVQSRPLFIERGEGSYLIDREGNRYLDGVSSLWATVHGHNHPVINKAISRQLEKIAHSTMLGLTHEPAAVLARKLTHLAPDGLSRVFYSESGSTAVEIALKIAFQYWQNLGGAYTGKTAFLCLKNGYHGDTIGAVSVGGIDLFHEIYRPLLFKSYQAPSPHCYRCELGLDPENCGMACAHEAENILVHHSEEIAAMIVEPLVQGAAGILTAPRGYLKYMAQACRRHGVLLIADEVAVGFGRTGRMFACEHEGVAPDIMCLGKGLTGGYLPLAATLTTEEIYRAFLGDYEEYKTFFHGHTYTGNPLACAAALANLELFEKERLLESLPEKIDFLHKGLQAWADHPRVGSIRQCGLMAGVELVLDRKGKTPFPPGARTGHRVAMACRKHGVIIRPLGDVIVIMPPLTITLEEMERLLHGVERAVKEVVG
jgi:adenosylmethionine-8-amino-7-oxononanoate aminotransferase